METTKNGRGQGNYHNLSGLGFGGSGRGRFVKNGDTCGYFLPGSFCFLPCFLRASCNPGIVIASLFGPKKSTNRLWFQDARV